MLQHDRARMLFALVVLLLLAACGDEQQVETIQTPGPSTAPSTEKVDEDLPVSTPFSLTIYASLAGESVVHKGEPLLVEVLLMLTGEESARIALADNSPWTHALSLELMDRTGKAVAADWDILGQAEAELEFSSNASEIRAVAALSPEVLNTLTPGDYQLAASFNTQNVAAPGAWAGRLVAPAIPVTLNADSGAQDEATLVYRHRLLARWYQLSDQPQAALDELDAALLLAPEDIDVLADKAELLVEQQRNDEAIALLQQAIALYVQRYPGATHPPRELIRRLNELSSY